MRSSTLAVVVLALLLLVVPSAAASSPGSSSEQTATAAAKAKKQGKAKRKRCRKGYVLRTVKVKRKGRMVRRKLCRKKRPAKKRQATSPTAPTPTPGPPSTAPQDEAARKFVEEKIANTRFTNCADGWNMVSCFVETRYSHFPDGGFAYCKLSLAPPRPADAVYSTFEIQNPRTDPDGSWSFDSVVPGYGTYRWSVAPDGLVNGTLQLAGEDRATTLFTLQHLPAARDCSP